MLQVAECCWRLPRELASSWRARKFLESIQDRAKTDRLDGEGLALYGLAAPLSPYPLKDEKVEQLDQWLSARRGLTQALSRLEQQQRELPYARQVLSPAIAHLREQVRTLDKQIASEVKQHERFELALRLQKVPGIGAVTSTAVTSRLVSCCFEHPDKFVAYLGLDVAIQQSGNAKGNRGLTKQGDAELRRLLYLCAKASLRVKGNPFALQYERELNKGLPKTAALCAVARKMARLCWSLWKHGSEYDPKRVGQPPERVGQPPKRVGQPPERVGQPPAIALQPEQKEG